jgi:hypothetical protein
MGGSRRAGSNLKGAVPLLAVGPINADSRVAALACTNVECLRRMCPGQMRTQRLPMGALVTSSASRPVKQLKAQL